jgi:hypothetical protein
MAYLHISGCKSFVSGQNVHWHTLY